MNIKLGYKLINQKDITINLPLISIDVIFSYHIISYRIIADYLINQYNQLISQKEISCKIPGRVKIILISNETDLFCHLTILTGISNEWQVLEN